MKRIIKNKFITCLLAAVLALVAAFCVVFPAIKTTTAEAYTTLPAGDSAIGNLYKNKKFDFNNLDLLAQKVGYTDIYDMVEKVSTVNINATSGENIKNSADFGNTVVNFGSYTFNDTTRELTWIPTFLSNTSEGPILTLWLASASSTNGTLSNQEISAWNSGHNSNKYTNPSSNNYATSMMRVKTLNNGGTYMNYSGGNTSQITPASIPYTATNDGTNKFEMFTTGALAKYITTPSLVKWQTTANRTKNDLNWCGNTDGYYPGTWFGDKLWLPSAYEVFDNTITENSTKTSFSENGGLWQTGNSSNRSKRSSSKWCWLRTGYASNWAYAVFLQADGRQSSGNVSSEYVVRPALHLNLLKVISHTHSIIKVEAVPAGCTTEGNVEYWYCEECEKCFSDANGENEIELDSTVIPATGHSFAEGWSSNPTHHWHAATCGHDEKSDLAVHIWDEGQVTKAPTCAATGETTYTCTVCSKTKTEPIAKLPHTPEDDAAVDPTCTETGKTAGSHCSVCGEILTAQETVPATGHNYEAVEGGTPPTCTTAGKGKVRCSRCGDEKVGDSIPATGHNPGDAATCTTPQICTVCET